MFTSRCNSARPPVKTKVSEIKRKISEVIFPLKDCITTESVAVSALYYKFKKEKSFKTAIS